MMIPIFLLVTIASFGYAELVQHTAKFTDNYIPWTYANFTSLQDAMSVYRSAKGPEALNEIGQIFLKYNQAKKFGLTLLHNHFPLKDNEVLVESANDKVAVTMPWRTDGHPRPLDEEYWSSYGFSGKSFINPHAWKLLDNGELSAYEYFESDEEGEQPPRDFTDALLKLFKKYGLQNVLGIRMKHYKSDSLGMETSDDVNRANIISLIPKDQFYDTSGETNGLPTFWMFDKNPAGTVLSTCYVCNSCRFK